MKILISEKISNEGINELKKRFDVKYKPNITRKSLLNCVQNCDALLVRTYTKVDKKLISKAKNLKIISRAGVGLDNIDVKYANKKRIVVANTPDANFISVAEMVFALILAISRKVISANNYVRNAKAWKRERFIGTTLNRKTLGIVGFGRIGRKISQIAKAFQMKVIAYDPFIQSKEMKKKGVTKSTLNSLLKNSDFVSVNVPLVKDTKNLIGKKEFGLMKKNTIFIDTSRGGVVNEKALIQVLKKERIKGAGIDVYSKEPPINSGLLKLKNVVLTPHIGGSTKEAEKNISMHAAYNIISFSIKNKRNKK